MTAMPRGAVDWTVDDLDRLPVDGLQYALHDVCPPEFEVFFAPLDWRPDNRTSRSRTFSSSPTTTCCPRT